MFQLRSFLRDRHASCHAGLCTIHLLTGAALLIEGALLHAACALAAAIIYACLCCRRATASALDPGPTER